MAKKFSEIKGVTKDSNGITHRGDSIFGVDVETMTIKRYLVKYCYIDWHGELVLYYCDPMQNRDFYPTSVSHYNIGIPDNMRKERVLSKTSHYKLLSTNIADATKILDRIKSGKYFGNLKKGDIIYAVDKSNNTITEVEVAKVGENDSNYFVIVTENHGTIFCGNSEHECNTSMFVDRKFHTYHTSFKCDTKFLSFHISKKDAEKVLRNYKKDKERRAQKKKEEIEKNPNGTPIRHNDNKGNPLHYGDTVCYVRKDSYGHTNISTAIIVGDSEKKIKIFDEGERITKRQNRKQINEQYIEKGWKPYQDDPNDGYHNLEKENVLLIKTIEND